MTRILALAAFLGRKRAASRADIFAGVDGYADRGIEAARRLLRRDISVICETMRVKIDYDAIEDVYRLTREVSRGDLRLTPEQKVALSLAMRSAEADPAAAVIEAAADLPVIGSAGWALPNIGLDARGEILLAAIISRTEISFRYRDSRGEETRRLVQPWTLTWRGERYLTGFDLDREGVRHFRLNRILGEIELRGEPGAFEPGEQATEVVAPWEADPDREAVIAVDDSVSWMLARRFGVEVEERDGELIIRVPYGHDQSFAAFLAGFGPEVKVLSPGSLVDALTDHLRGALDAHGAA
ncbi:MAG: helix-turn-helix transcriptional regulator [Actinomycetota bacterium]